MLVYKDLGTGTGAPKNIYYAVSVSYQVPGTGTQRWSACVVDLNLRILAEFQVYRYTVNKVEMVFKRNKHMFVLYVQRF